MRLLKSKEKKERALGTKLGLKAYRCSSPKCATIRRPSRPGMHGRKFVRGGSEFKLQLMEKQKIKVSYGLTERQMKNIFKKASESKKSAIDFINQKLEMRLDSVVFRMGLTPSLIMARHLVSHGHFLVNGRKVTIPSYQVRVGDIVAVKEKMAQHLLFKDLKNILKVSKDSWFSIDPEKLEGKVKSMPQAVELPFNINLVVDYYSR
ncbi:MAG: 30S ribosomal protein S4 [Candidatus Wolfebacteria bacterium GW2011_GWC1_43_10]|uniref:Small ribosomal subunit protein uS4 n=2 Tax=Candidatus Wolfeibacteriota TaxID=1752735 RepID=A0A0G1EFB7_9BACT|nr:MAG: 30S ribosomal protein S4 [Candidatus Wolfebacteria bacterium GW2011_GWC1_43_10]KKT22949.1 MAG: 30S ribosomal protein S4 [Parcubacteria group bacterium GW2011_GWB1_43_8b]OGM89906.1 MAG: 30S ribosomal protein S4 [Candidatus Wolfebacteria bacterium GWA1_42_9]